MDSSIYAGFLRAFGNETFYMKLSDRYQFNCVVGKQGVNLRVSLKSAQTAAYYNDTKQEPQDLKFGKEKIELNVHVYLSYFSGSGENVAKCYFCQ